MAVENSIQEIKARLATITDTNDPFIKLIKEDERKGVQAIHRSWQNKLAKEQKLKDTFFVMRKYEENLWNNGYDFIGGVDEVGRGPLAGPVVAACVILPKDFYLPGLTDSKKLSKEKRDEFDQIIRERAISYGIGMATTEEIDQMNIYESTKLAMGRAIRKMEQQPDYLLLDAMKLTVNIPQTSLIKGDSKSISIAASSVIAKVTRDTYMEELALIYPQYGFNSNMGYGTKEHLQALQTYGITKEHRRTFTPVQQTMTLF
ncbi:ribonuclease HII [Evansella sp. AB-rgal1]|uniref:ribonuclease HII n=1 Tax=Evansella sp. AB-rgal1 TaxID=3242696 RepID=UPI00359CC5A4